jgi:hypothetical protein
MSLDIFREKNSKYIFFSIYLEIDLFILLLLYRVMSFGENIKLDGNAAKAIDDYWEYKK